MPPSGRKKSAPAAVVHGKELLGFAALAGVKTMGEAGSSEQTALRSAEALIVEPSVPDALFWSTVLASAGFHVTVTSSFVEAKARIAILPPALLLTAIRLHDYNGLQLVLRAKSAYADTCAIVVADSPDPVLQQEAHGLGATFVSKPITREDLLAVVFRSLFCGSTEPLRPPFERRTYVRRRQIANTLSADRRVTADRRQDPVAIVRAAQQAELR